ncbi:MAG: hypothetical protein M1838_005225 [Thelocarpon superellum]|nr:MAG: hypothetical protein M1838_005225 [Thelocarpon superellum]
MLFRLASLWLLAASAVVALPAASNAPLAVSTIPDGPLTTSDRWIVDSNGKRVKLRCVNWAGHMETNIPEGLQHQPVDAITSWIAKNNFNCVRLTYSIDMALNPDLAVSDSFPAAAVAANVDADQLHGLYQQAVQNNPWLSSSTVLETFEKVIQSLDSKGVKVILDNHVSKAMWCCALNDGNGWFDTDGSTTDIDSKYFDIPNWVNGLKAMATFSATQPNVIAMSLRNELRPLSYDTDDWYTNVEKGAQAIHSANDKLLIVIGGLNYATDMSYLGKNPLDRSAFPNRVVWEFHWYKTSYPIGDCNFVKGVIGGQTGYLLTSGQSYTGPLWMSEFGTDVGSPDTDWISCVVDYLTGNDADWAVWALQGSYYIRQGNIAAEETWGLLNANWSDWRNPSFPGLLGGMWDQTQGP